MEDELERNSISLFNKNEEEGSTFLYLCKTCDEKNDNSTIITTDINMANIFVREKAGKFVIFKKDTLGLYKFYDK